MLLEEKLALIVMLSASVGKEARPFMSGVSAACAAIERLGRSLAAELGPAGVRVVTVRGGAMFETRTIEETTLANARTAGMPVEQFRALIQEASLMRRAPSVSEVADAVAMLASPLAACITGQTINACCGLVLH